MNHISSRDNPLYKRVARLMRGHDGRQIVLEGIHLCQAWLRYFGTPELALFDADRIERNGELSGLAGALSADSCIACEPGLMRGLSAVEHGQGVYFVVEAPQPVAPPRIEQNCLWLDRVQDPGNLGTLLRTAAAAGIEQAYLSTGCASAWSQKVLRSAQGAHFVMSIHEHLDLRAEHGKLAIPLIATSLGDAQSLYAAALPARCAWLVGNEGQGVAAELLELADIRLFIPQSSKVESLNVAAAAAICLFEQRRQHGPA